MDNAEIRDFIDGAIKENEVMLFMKGTPEAPACGFSMRTSGALNALGVRYAALDILPDPRIREELSGLSGWPTIPQLFVKGELVGGCDIVVEMYENGELAELLGVDMPEEDDAPGRGRAGGAARSSRATSRWRTTSKGCEAAKPPAVSANGAGRARHLPATNATAGPHGRPCNAG